MDEETLPQEGPEPVAAPVEEAPDPQEAPETTLNEIEQVAYDLGWRPKDEFKGDETAWKPAADYIRAGKDIQTGMARELKAVRETLENVSRTSGQIMQEQLQRQKAELEKEYQQAWLEGDRSEADRIQRELGHIEQRAQAPQPIPAAVTDFAQRNSAWFQRDPLATDLAIQTADKMARAGYSAEDQVKAAEREVRRAYPELFPQPQKAPAVAAPQSREAAPRQGKRGFHDMPPAAQKMARDMVERGVIPNTESYVANFFKDQGK